jgi:hypothetical protein
MKRFITRKRVSLLVAVAVAIGATVGIYAYFTAPGAGTGSATVGTASDILLSGDTVGDLYPDGPDVNVTVDVENPGEGSQHVDTISGEVQDSGLCLGSWFEVDSITYDATIEAGGSDSADTVVRMIDSATNQDACQGAELTIDWSSN